MTKLINLIVKTKVNLRQKNGIPVHARFLIGGFIAVKIVRKFTLQRDVSFR